MPILVVQHDGAAVCESFQTGYDLIGLFGHGLVKVFAGFVILIDLSGLFQSNREVLFRQQIYRFLAVLDTSGGIDTRTYLEYYIADGDFFFRQSAYVDNGLQPYARITVELFQTVIGKYAVLSHNRYDVRGDADCHQVQQRNQMMKFDAVADSECLHEFKTYSAARKMFVRIGVVFALGVQYSYGRGQHFIGYVVVADDEVDAFFLGVCNFVYSLDAAVQHDNQSHTGFGGIVHTLCRNAISLVVTVGYVIIYVRIELLNKLIDQGHGGGSVYIVISINQNALFLSHCLVQAFYGHVHIFHEERVVQIR